MFSPAVTLLDETKLWAPLEHLDDLVLVHLVLSKKLVEDLVEPEKPCDSHGVHSRRSGPEVTLVAERVRFLASQMRPPVSRRR